MQLKDLVNFFLIESDERKSLVLGKHMYGTGTLVCYESECEVLNILQRHMGKHAT